MDKTILLIEDDYLLRQSIMQLLSENNYDFDQCGGGAFI